MKSEFRISAGFRVGLVSGLALPVPAGPQVDGNALLSAAPDRVLADIGSHVPGNGDVALFSKGDVIIVYAGQHYGRLHRVIEVRGRCVDAYQVDTHDWVVAPLCDCEMVDEHGRTREVSYERGFHSGV